MKKPSTPIQDKKRVHKKPTAEYGHLIFSKSGNVSKKTFKLSSKKDEQEIEVAKYFVEKLNSLGRNMMPPVNLAEDGHDATTQESGQNIEIQITELLPHEYASQVYDHKNSKWIQRGDKYFYTVIRKSGIYELDPLLVKNVLKNKIINKVEKNYTKNSTNSLVLLIFSTSPFFDPDALKEAKDYLVNANHPFDEIWYFDLQTNPIKVWS